MKVYVAGPFSRGSTPDNVRVAIDTAEIVWAKGDYPYVPHLTMFWDMMHLHQYEEWLAYDMVWLKSCDAVLRLPGMSTGADKEVAEARLLKMPVYLGLPEYLKARGG